jgi:hypothetical protein
MSLERTETAPTSPAPQGRARASWATPDPQRLGAWLAGPQLRCDDGQVLSWTNPSHPGYRYPEATALWLSWAAWRHERGLTGPGLPAVRGSAQWLRAELQTHGSLGRGDRRYLFDTALAVHALVRAARIPGWVDVADHELRALSAGLDHFLADDTPVIPAPDEAPRWSDRWSGHLLRAGALLLQAGFWLADTPTIRRAERTLARSERFEDQQPCYLHALAYQAEGELLLAALGQTALLGRVQSTAERLARLQRDDGLLPGWAGQPDTARCDSTAQALRLWAAVDPARFARPMARAGGALAALQHSSGGLPYQPGSADLTTWVGLFTDQALHWARWGAEPLALL